MSVVEPTYPSLVRRRHHVQPIFHPQLRRTQEVIRRPEWVRHTGEAVAHRGSLGTFALIGILFANCFGGGYGFEETIGSSGPLIALIVCLVLPWIWVLPTGLAVSELSTAVPSNSGVLMWVNAAFPPFVSFLCILSTIFITFVGNSTYPNLTSEYVETMAPLNKGEIAAVKIGVITICCVLNIIGVEIVGTACMVMCVITTSPFLIFSLQHLFTKGFNGAAISHVDLPNVDWPGFLSIVSWNYANIENAGAVVEEVSNPRKTMPRAMVPLMFTSYVAYVLPMLSGVSVMGPDQDWSKWKAGYWTEVASSVSGEWMRYYLFAGSVVSGFGLALTSMCCTSRVMAGMGTMQMFPKKISRVIGYYHPRLGTPIPSIVINAVVTLVFCVSMDFGDVVALSQGLYCLRMVLVYATVIKLRIDHPNLPRPYALPCNTMVAALCLVPATLFAITAAIVSSMVSLPIGLSLVGYLIVGMIVSYFYCRAFARNGFQGVIVQCEISEDDDDDVAAPDEAETTHLHQGVFYSDGCEDRPGDLLLGILPLGDDAPSPDLNDAAAEGKHVLDERMEAEMCGTMGREGELDALGELAQGERIGRSAPAFARSNASGNGGNEEATHRFLMSDAEAAERKEAHNSNDNVREM